MPKLLLATNNPGKVREFRHLLQDSGWDIITPADIGLTLEVDETGTTYEENARLKAEAFSRASGLAALADDSGLEVDTLGGAPGVHSARFGGTDLPHSEKIRLLLDRLAAMPDAQRGARFRAVIVIAVPDGRTYVSEGVCEGRIAHAPRGTGGFGYDPIFLVEDGALTIAELSEEQKNRVSHRARAAAGAVERLRALGTALPDPRTGEGLTHIDEAGRARMVDVSDKVITARVAVARGRVTMQRETLRLILAGEVAKGNVLTTAQIAGIMAAKRTHELIPMCHPLLLTKVDVRLEPDEAASAVEIEATVRTTGVTGVEMEALTAVTVAGLTIYDMCKAVDRGMRLEAVRLARKSGGASGDIVLE